MSTPNSHNNSPSSSSENDESEVSTEQRAIALLPQAYPFKLTEDYQAAFDSDDPAVVLPSYYRLAMWQKYVGDPHWQRVQEETAEYNRRVEEEFTHELAEIETDNQQRSDRNRAKKLAYANQLKRYHADKKDYDRKVESAREKARENVIKQLHKELDNAIEQQSELIDLAFEDAVDNALSQPKMKGESNIVWWVLVVLTIAGLATFPTVFGPSIYGFLAYRAAVYKRKQCPEELIHVVNHYESSYHETRYKFLLHQPRTHRFGPRCVYSPACIFADSQGEKKERNPLGKHKVEDYEEPYDILNNIVAFVPLVGCALAFKALPSKNYLMAIARRLGSYEFKQQRRKKLHVVLDDSFKHADDNSWQAVDEWIKEYLNHNNPIPNEPDEPIRPKEEPLRTLPSPPTLKIAVPLEPPADCFDTAEQGLVEYVFKGSQVFGAEQVRTLARTRLFADDQVHPHFTFGGVPFPITGTSPHMLVIGNSGSGKTTTMLRLMSSLLPLSTFQANRLANRLSNGAEVYPESLHQWGRSRTHQAVVYNAKGEYVRYLEAFGFDSEVDLFNLDPVAPNGFAWDVAADIDDRESIKKFAEQLIPKSVKASQDASTEFWYGTARGVLEAIIVSLRNAALTQDKKPSWTLRDLVKIAKNNNYIKHVLMWHDTPLEAVEEFFSDAAQQTSSVMMTLRQCMRLYDGVAERWYHAKNCGRAISLKKWSLQGRHSLLVLPNTMENVASYGPLNKAVMKALAGLWLNEAYSLYFDESGTQHKRHRYLFLDEFGQAGQFDELERLMAEGRSFGVHVVLGLQQLSQVREAYGENGSETIVGLCPYKACMRSNDPRTQEWMSKLVGNCLRSYEKSTFTYATSNGVTITQSSSQSKGGGTGTNQSSSHSETEVKSDTTGESEAHTDSKNRSTTSAPKRGEQGTTTSGDGKSDTKTKNTSHTESDSTTDGTTSGTSAQTNWSSQTGQSQASNRSQNKGGSTTTELRGEPAIETYEFANFPDPETTGNCEGVYITPTLPVFRTTLQMAQVQPEFESPEKLKQPILRRPKKEEEEVSRPTQWNDQDLERLFLDKPHTQLNAPYMQTVLDNPPVFEQAGGSKVEQPLIEHLDDDELLADFQFE